MTDPPKNDGSNGRSNHDRLLGFLSDGTLAHRLAVAYGSAGTPEEKTKALAAIVRQQFDELKS